MPTNFPAFNRAADIFGQGPNVLAQLLTAKRLHDQNAQNYEARDVYPGSPEMPGQGGMPGTPAVPGAPEGLKLNRAEYLSALAARQKGAGGGSFMIPAGNLDPRFSGPLSGLGVPAKGAAAFAQAGMAAGEKKREVTAEEGKKATAAVSGGQNLLRLGEAWKKAKLGQPGAGFGQRMGEWAGGKVAQFGPAPLAAEVAPGVAEYLAEQRLTVERFLREATGAAAPTEEKIDYAVNLLPAPGDTQDIAQQKIQRFMTQLRQEGAAAATRQMAEGRADEAARIQGYLETQLGPMEQQLKQIFTDGTQAPGAPRLKTASGIEYEEVP